MGIFLGLIGRIIVFVTCVSTAVSVGNIVNLVDTYSDEIEYIVEKSSNYDSLDALFDDIMEEDVDESDEEAAQIDELNEEEAAKEAEIKAEEEAKKKAEEEAAKKAEEEAKKKAEEEAAKEAELAEEESNLADAGEEKTEADNKEEPQTEAVDLPAPAPAAEAPIQAPAGKVEIGRVYMEDCGQDTGYWVVTYSDGSVEYIDD